MKTHLTATDRANAVRFNWAAMTAPGLDVDVEASRTFRECEEAVRRKIAAGQLGEAFNEGV